MHHHQDLTGHRSNTISKYFFIQKNSLDIPNYLHWFLSRSTIAKTKNLLKKKKSNLKLKKSIFKKNNSHDRLLISRNWLVSEARSKISQERRPASLEGRVWKQPRVLLPPKFRSFVMVSQYPWNGKSILERFTNALESGIEGRGLSPRKCCRCLLRRHNREKA